MDLKIFGYHLASNLNKQDLSWGVFSNNSCIFDFCRVIMTSGCHQIGKKTIIDWQANNKRKTRLTLFLSSWTTNLQYKNHDFPIFYSIVKYSMKYFGTFLQINNQKTLVEKKAVWLICFNFELTVSNRQKAFCQLISELHNSKFWKLVILV